MTEARRLFAEAYIANGFNAVKAYHIAYPKDGKTTKNPRYPYTILKDPEVIDYINKRREEIYNSLNIDANRIITELATIGFAEKGDTVYNTSAKLKALELLSKNLGLQTIKTENKDVIEVSLVEDNND